MFKLKSEFFACIMLATVTVAGLSACQRGGNDSSTLSVTPTNLKGDWEVNSLTYSGGTHSVSLNSAAMEAGYSASVTKLQLEITDNQIRILTSDEVEITADLQRNYQIQGSKLVPIPQEGEKVSSFDVILLKANSMSIRSSGTTSPVDLVINLVRISNSDLASNKLHPLPQSANYSVKTPNQEFADSMGTGGAPSAHAASADGKIGTEVGCRFRHRDSFLTVNNYLFHRSNNSHSLETSSEDPNLALAFPVTFDWKKPTEDITTTLNGSSSGHFLLGKYVGAASKSDLLINKDGSCNIVIHRDKRMLDLQADCKNVRVGNATSGELGDLKLNEKCLLRF